MIEREPGHVYGLTTYDGWNIYSQTPPLVFFKRIGPAYPGNTGYSHPGTNCQEVLRALIARVRYLDSQIPDQANKQILLYLRGALYQFEERAARRHGRELVNPNRIDIENIPTCPTCGHIQCPGDCRKADSANAVNPLPTNNRSEERQPIEREKPE